jgi:4a-hydroxytetrahydrobiopterin dehydratase
MPPNAGPAEENAMYRRQIIPHSAARGKGAPATADAAAMRYHVSIRPTPTTGGGDAHMTEETASALGSKKCVPCEAGTPPLTPEQATGYLREVPQWRIEDNKIVRELKLKDFKEALAFVNQVGEIAEDEGHHPDIHVSYNRVTLKLWTHAIGGLSENDFIVAAKIDALGR